MRRQELPIGEFDEARIGEWFEGVSPTHSSSSSHPRCLKVRETPHACIFDQPRFGDDGCTAVATSAARVAAIRST